MKIKHWLLLVYFLISWKEYGCDTNCPSSYWGNNLINTTSGGTPTATIINAVTGEMTNTVYQYPGKNCTMKVVTQEKRFEANQVKEMDTFVKSLNLQEIKEEFLDHPETLKWGFKKKKVTVTEKDL